ncbi:MAG: type II toxin-antitoxin system VapC family toxin [Gammaproteobacteria bacterium]|nr:type II toxin-antitoxin system VapC family toxin [Gammaproteobacteria bacterium]
MSAVLLDTHAWIWSLMDSSRLGSDAKTAIIEADAVHVSPISVYEIVRKARLGKWPEIVPHIDALLTETQTVSAPFTRAVATRAGALDWAHRDPFDRFIAATAIEMGWALVSKDPEFDALDRTRGWQGRVWS